MIIVDMEKSSSVESRCVMVGLQMDRHGSELVVYAISKVAREGDRVVAVHVSRTSDLCSSSNQALIKALDNFLSAYQGLCNLNQVVLAGRVARGTSIKKVLVKEAASCGAATVVVGLNKNCSLSGSSSVAKYCAKKLRPTTALIAVQNGRVVFERAATKTTSGEAGKPNIRSILHPSVGMDTEAIIPSSESRLTPNSSNVVLEEGWNDRRLLVHGMTMTTTTRCDSSSITLLVRRLPEPNVGWPLLRRAIRANAEPLKEAEPHNMSVVQWVMNLPDRSTTCTPSAAPTDLIKDLEAILRKNSSTCRWFQHEELQSSTNQFSTEKLIGKGGSSQVFKGDLPDGQQVAIKLSELSNETSGAFLSEVDIITTLQHEHIVPLIGICVERRSSLSIYDYFPRGSLEENLHGKRSKSPLSWEIRFKVAVGVAEGLNYLHCGTSRQVIHRDIKSSNILLTEEYEPKISDFGLAMWAPTDKSFETQNDIVGTFGYLAPEYFMYGKVSDKTDVYAYGVVLLELLTGRKPISDERPKGEESLVVWATRVLERGDMKEMLDSDLDGNCDHEDQIRRLVLIATLCIRRSARLRPQMSQVLMLLKGEDPIDPWITLGGSISSEEQDCQDEEACPVSSVGSHLSLALLDVEEDDASSISFEQNHLSSLDEYLRERWSRSPSFD
ncbi:receptor-like cytosolic serine/threonine-protein kinase RBK1 [Iris pallida]|uniref:Receptor-like cytosolic serine/threonine-protein kinase RBK1 n=1 Tax=Iris pallida TaxID=29817 RepID=A0AAX6HG73_IRIPA|nr:receptor-like cytosolic serine/threonine-protein kinase RBK1 [Iris pallida]